VWNSLIFKIKKPKVKSGIGLIDTDPIRAELFSGDQLIQHARDTASSYRIETKTGHDHLLPRLADNEKILLETHDLLNSVIKSDRRISPSGEWLLDNFYLVEEQIRTARRHLPEKYSSELPYLVNGPYAGFPRVYHIARELIAHSDGRIDADNLFTFINAYQSVTPLFLGELWAIPIMFRFALIENLRRIANIISSNRQDIDSANYWVDQMTEIARNDPKSLILVIADMARSNPPMTSTFVAEITRQLRGQSGALSFPLTWIEQRLNEKNLTIEQMINTGTQAQAADQVSIGNSIGSLRLLDKINWCDFVERLSVVEHILRSDPDDEYTAMDFETRDRYRHVVEKISKMGGFSEWNVAQKAVDIAALNRHRNSTKIRASHMGYYLIDEGRYTLEEALSIQISLPDKIKRASYKYILPQYLCGIFCISLIGAFLGYTRLFFYSWFIALPIMVLLLFPISQGAITFINWFITLLLIPVSLPKLDYSKGIPADRRTIVVIPTVLSGYADISGLVDSLEIRYLANKDPNLYFALLTDLKTAHAQEVEGDTEIVDLLAREIEGLNKRYQSEKPGIFFLMHRSRTWNSGEGVWMGYERKRGILEAFSNLLSHKEKNQFSRIVGNLDILNGIRYVITLDTDTQLPRNSARSLIGAIAHPLSRPVRDPEKMVIREGYGILQPRVAPSLSESGVSRFASIFGGDQGIDPYSRAISDVYQDAFHEGSYIGKGIYDLEEFSHIVENRFPENLILSHDLLEGCYARSGLVSDVHVFEEYPSSYLADSKRRHRWIRGDWQIIAWLLPSVTDTTGEKQKNPLSFLSRWKIFDNLRRSLIAPVTLFLLIISWIHFLYPLLWTTFIVSLYLIPVFIIICWEVFKKPTEQTWMLHLYDCVHNIQNKIAVPLLTLVFLPYEAYNSLDAIFRSCWRMYVSHRNLLEWTTHQEVGRKGTSDILSSYCTMWPGPVIGVLLIPLLYITSPYTCPVIAVFALAWIFSPGIAWFISQPIRMQKTSLTHEQEVYLRGIARRTWRFFETFVTDNDHYLLPDNYQEHPMQAIAHRTSPTNIGLSLLANLTAYDFGYIPVSILVQRTQNTLDMMGLLKRYRNHFYNWYDTITLEPLIPQYVSTVDSGNLVGDLLVLQQGLYEIASREILSEKFGEGLGDTIQVLTNVIQVALKEQSESVLTPAKSSLSYLRIGATKIPTTPKEALIHLYHLNQIASEVQNSLNVFEDDEVRWWAAAIKRQIEEHITYLKTFVSWELTGNIPVMTGDIIPDILKPYQSLFCAHLEILNNQIPILQDIADIRNNLHSQINPLITWLETAQDPDIASDEYCLWVIQTLDCMKRSSERAEDLIRLLSQLAEKCRIFSDIDYEFLYDKTSKLLSVGYNVTDLRRDNVFYDLLASEARITSFIGIASGKLPQEHWFALGRLLTTVGSGKPTLISWSGSMFEYLMPLLVMPTYENTLLDRSYRAVVARQIEYGHKKGLPWGISESGYNFTDINLNYQYRAFGVPGLGFKRGLAEDMVIAPYAAAMGLMVNPALACLNLKQMDTLGYTGKYGFYESIDYTPSRVVPGKKHAVVQSFMAHHQGMILLSLAYTLLNKPMQRRFESDPSLQATVMLLQEKMPRNAPFYPHTSKEEDVHNIDEESGFAMRIFNTANTPRHEVHILSNGRYQVVINNSGSGYSKWNDLAVTRWREDPTSDRNGTFCYIRDLASGEFWSNGYQPCRKEPDSFRTIFKQSRAEFERKDHKFDTRTVIIVSPEDDVELRKIRVTNRSFKRRTIEFTSYAEVVLAPQPTDETHPAFSNLFVQTEIIREKNAIVATRRPRSDTEFPPWMFHLMTVHGTQVRKTSFETDRSKFIGRGNSHSKPLAMIDSSTLSDTAGNVLDPIVAIRCTITLEPQETAGVNIFTGISNIREGAIALIEKYYDKYIADRVSELAWTHAQVMLIQLNASERDAQLFCALASSIIYVNPSRRANRNVLLKNNRGQSGLWGYGISGDIPIVLVRIKNINRIRLVKEMVQAHAYWRMKGLIVDLVIWNEDQSVYRQDLQDEIIRQMPQGSDSHLLNSKGGIFIRHLEQMSDEDKILIQTVARVIISDREGMLSEQMERSGWIEGLIPRLVPTSTGHPITSIQSDRNVNDLLFFNGTGGFSPDGREYIILTGKGIVTPAPWVNVLANETFGTVVSESGSAYTWSDNAHEFRLTPWINDPILNQSGEALYIRDENTGKYWSPTPFPVPGAHQYVTRHGFGYSVFEYSEQGISTELTISVSINNPVKIMVLKIRNSSGRTRILSVTGYVEWVLSELRTKSLLHVITEIDPISGAIFARNPYNSEFPNKVAFLDSNILNRTVTGDRYEFIGRNRSLDNPAAMEKIRLSNKVGAGLDPCAAIQVLCELTDGEEREIIFTLGVGRDSDEARFLALQNRPVLFVRTALKEVKKFWNQTLGAISISTPDKSVDILVNGWLLYQTIVSRLWARSGFYQSGGAFGFRDQLQDVMALIHTRPDFMRKQLLICAGHQFKEGDVQHWWHPPLSRGVRTHCSDDYLWLPFACCRYVLSTGDTGVLDEQIPFIEGRILFPEEDSYYDMPCLSKLSGTLYEHCVLSIRWGLKFGEHGLPLMGTGDWNDGMNLVGVEGKGESVWLGFFLYDILMRFAKISDIRQDILFSEFCRKNAEKIKENLHRDGWDGRWYRRAYLDSGKPLGSHINKECMIDSISQSWAVLSGAAPDDRAKTAMKSLQEYLILPDEGLIPLLTPPFDTSSDNIGYIKGYIPGVRENGGQYSHAAIWVVMAYAALKESKQAWDLLPFINPIHHSKTPEDVRKYRVEPYVIASDIYSTRPHTGRGGWTWYTGSSGWMYTLILESLLGVKIFRETMTFEPCVPEGWNSYQIEYRYRSTLYHIAVHNSGSGSGLKSIAVDGIVQKDAMFHMIDDQNEHKVIVVIGT
jgi:cellobiose phosphorylase